ncbi:MAG: histidine kinase [Clostridium sp.]
MKKTTTWLLLIMSLFAIGSFVESEMTNDMKMINIILIMLILILHVLGELTKIKSMYISVMEVSLLTMAFCFGFKGFEYILPIIFFNILGEKIGLYSFLLGNFFLSVIIIGDNYFNLGIYNVIVSMYLYELKDQYHKNSELKEVSRGQRHEQNLLEERLYNLEKCLEQNSIMSSLKERNFIAQKLHDYLGHRITSAVMQLEVTKETMESSPELSKKYLVSAIDNLRQGMEEIRGVLKNFKPIDKMIGIEEIKELLLNFQYTTGIKVHLNTEGDTSKIHLKIWMAIEENLKEALTNATKYSKATEVTISIFVYHKFIRVHIQDNGIGIENKISKSLGLRGMEERILNLGGRIEFYDDNGFNINMIINLGD